MLTHSRNPTMYSPIPGYRPTWLIHGRLPNAKSSLHASMQSAFASVNTFRVNSIQEVTGNNDDRKSNQKNKSRAGQTHKR